MIKNVVLDMGNVLLDFNPEVSLDMYCSSEEEKDIIRRELFKSPEWLMADKGLIKDRDKFDHVKDKIPAKYHEALKNCVDNWYICMVPLEGAGKFCQSIKDKGLGIYVLSNASDVFYDYFPKFLPLDYFDGVFVSAEYLLLKPEVDIYRRFLKEYGLKAEECLFVDDTMRNVEGARLAGMNAVQFKGDYDEVLALTSSVPRS